MVVQHRFVARRAAHELRSPALTALSFCKQSPGSDPDVVGQARNGSMRYGAESNAAASFSNKSCAGKASVRPDTTKAALVRWVYRKVLEDLLPLARPSASDFIGLEVRRRTDSGPRVRRLV